MANPHRGETALQVGEATYVLRCGNNALAELEEALNLPIQQLWRRWNDRHVGVRELRAMLWAFAREAHPQLTLQDAGNLMDQVDRAELTQALLQAVQRAFPSSAGGRGDHPPTAAGTGSGS